MTEPKLRCMYCQEDLEPILRGDVYCVICNKGNEVVDMAYANRSKAAWNMFKIFVALTLASCAIFYM